MGNMRRNFRNKHFQHCKILTALPVGSAVAPGGPYLPTTLTSRQSAAGTRSHTGITPPAVTHNVQRQESHRVDELTAHN
jgi:hypothetical protein